MGQLPPSRTRLVIGGILTAVLGLGAAVTVLPLVLYLAGSSIRGVLGLLAGVVAVGLQIGSGFLVAQTGRRAARLWAAGVTAVFTALTVLLVVVVDARLGLVLVAEAAALALVALPPWPPAPARVD